MMLGHLHESIQCRHNIQKGKKGKKSKMKESVRDGTHAGAAVVQVHLRSRAPAHVVSQTRAHGMEGERERKRDALLGADARAVVELDLGRRAQVGALAFAGLLVEHLGSRAAVAGLSDARHNNRRCGS